MKITIVTAGKIKEKYLTDGIKEFMKRLTPYANVKIVEISEERMPDSPSDAEKTAVLAREGERLLKQVPQAVVLSCWMLSVRRFRQRSCRLILIS